MAVMPEEQLGAAEVRTVGYAVGFHFSRLDRTFVSTRLISSSNMTCAW